MFEVNDEEALVAGVALGAIATGLGTGVGILVCMLPHNEARAQTQSPGGPMAFDRGGGRTLSSDGGDNGDQVRKPAQTEGHSDKTPR